MSEPSSSPLPDAIAAVELEWKARTRVESAFHAFYMNASHETADALSSALDAWKQAIRD